MKNQFTYMEENSHSPCEFEPSLKGYNRNEYQEILWLKSGNGKAIIVIDDKEQDVPFNSFVIIGKGRIHHMKLEGFIEGAIIRFSDEFLPKIPYFLFNEHADKIWIDVSEEKDFFNQISNLFKLEKNKKTSRSQNAILQNLLLAMFEKLECLKKQQVSSIKNIDDVDFELFERFYHLLDKNFGKEHNIEFYANAMRVSSRKLSNLNNKILGKPTGKVIEEKLLIEAKRLLLYSNYSIKEITYRLGFEDNSYFTKFFKRNTHINPSDFKAHQLAVLENTSTAHTS